MPKADYTDITIKSFRIVFFCVWLTGIFFVDTPPVYAATPEYPQDTAIADKLEAALEEILHKPYAEKEKHIRFLYRKMLSFTDSLFTYHITRFENIIRRADDREASLEMELLKIWYRAWHKKCSYTESATALRAVVDRAADEPIGHIEARGLKMITQLYWNNAGYQQAFEAFFDLGQAMKQMQPSDFPLKTEYLVAIGEAHYFFQDYQQAILYFEEAAAQPLTDFDTPHIAYIKNNLGLCYQHLEQLDKSDSYFRDIIDDPQSETWGEWKSIATGNLGYNYYLRGNYETAEPMLRHDAERAITVKDYGLAVGSLTPLADILLRKGHWEEAGRHLQLAREYVGISGQLNRLRLLYPVMSKWHAARGDSKMAGIYVDSTTLAANAYNKKFSTIKLLRAEQKINLQQRQMLLAEKQQQLKELYIIIAIAILLFAGSLLGWIFRNRYLMRKQQIKELELENVSKELKLAKTQLDNVTHRVRENQKLIDRLQSSSRQNPENEDIIRQIRDSTLLTEEEWVDFKRLFEQLHPGYIGRLLDSWTSLTPAEIRYIVLSKLKFNHKEMAGMLGISPQSLRVTWHRLRKKLNISEQAEVLELDSIM